MVLVKRSDVEGLMLALARRLRQVRHDSGCARAYLQTNEFSCSCSILRDVTLIENAEAGIKAATT